MKKIIGGRTPPEKIGTEASIIVDSSAPTLARPTPVPPSEQDPLIGQAIRQSYVIKERIGVGGMGSVYLAEQVGLRRKVAIKIIATKLARDTNALARFHREAQALARLSHPNIVTIHEYGVKEDEPCKQHPFFVMEYVEGETLQEIINQHPKGLSFEEAASYLRSILAALLEAHNVAIVHRDLKPGNVLMKPLASGGYIPKVCDFGLAKELLASSGNQTLEGTMHGTPGYMAPEQLRGQEVDHRTDLFAVGVIFFEMLTGKNPFGIIEGTPLADMIAATLTREPLMLRDLRKNVPEETEAFIGSALRRNLEERVASAHEMISWLDRIRETAGAMPLVPKKKEPPAASPKERSRYQNFMVLVFVALGVAIAFALYQIPALFHRETARPRIPRVEQPAAAHVAPATSPVTSPALAPAAAAPDTLANAREQCLAALTRRYVSADCRRLLARLTADRSYNWSAHPVDRFIKARVRQLARPRRPAPAAAPPPSSVDEEDDIE